MYIHTKCIRNTVAALLLMYTARYPLPEVDSVYSRGGSGAVSLSSRQLN